MHLLQELRASGADLFLPQQALGTSSEGPGNVQVLGVLAAFGRAIIVGWMDARLARAGAEDKKAGRPRITGVGRARAPG